MEHDDRHANFAEYRRLILAHMDGTNDRLTGLEESVNALRIRMGVLTVKIALVTAGIVLVGGAVIRTLVAHMLKSDG